MRNKTLPGTSKTEERRTTMHNFPSLSSLFDSFSKNVSFVVLITIHWVKTAWPSELIFLTSTY